MNNLPFSVDNPGVAILGSEYCSGYIDSIGKWNTGFYCPASDETVSMFCCGSDNYKYCCAKEDEVLQEEIQGLTLVIGGMVGTFTALLLLTIVFCMYCPWCSKKKKAEKEICSVYHLHHPNSSGSEVTQIHRVSNGNPLAPSLTGQHTGRPFQQIVLLYSQEMSHSHTLPHSLSDHHSFRVKEKHEDIDETGNKFVTMWRQSCDQPPACHVLPRASFPLIPQDTAYILSETAVQADSSLHSLSQTMAKVNMMEMDKEEEEDIDQST